MTEYTRSSTKKDQAKQGAKKRQQEKNQQRGKGKKMHDQKNNPGREIK